MKIFNWRILPAFLAISATALSDDIPSKVQSVTDERERSPDDPRPMAAAADLLRCSVTRKSKDTLVFTITVAGEIPKVVKNRSFYAVYIDLDSSARTGNCDRHRGTDLCVYSQKLPGKDAKWKDSVILDSHFVLKYDYKVSHKLKDGRKTIEITAKSKAFVGQMDFLYRVTSGVDCYDVMPEGGTYARYFDFE